MNTPSKILTFLGASAFLSLANLCQAEIVAFYDFGTAQSPSSASSDSSLNSKAGTFDVKQDSPIKLSNRSSGNPGYARTLGGNEFTTEQEALENGSYAAFKITPEAGYSLDFTSGLFQYDMSTSIRTGATGPVTASFAIYSSVDNFTTRLGAISTETGSPAGPSPWNSTGAYGDPGYIPEYTIDLSSLGVQAVGQAVEFRIYAFFDNPLTFGGIDNLTVSASVIPEPSTASLVGAGLGVACLLLSARSGFRPAGRRFEQH